MSDVVETLAERVAGRFEDVVTRIPSRVHEATFELPAERLLEVCTALRDEELFRFEQLMDVCGVDYLAFGKAEWKTVDATDSGYSRGVNLKPWADDKPQARRFAVVYHLLSISRNQRLRLRVFCPPEEPPMIDSVTDIWASANWFEREVFDLYGVLFNGHPDLRRILTDYGFIGHPFRKDFPLSGHVEVRYDPEKGRVIYQPVSIEPRTLVPKTIRQDSRYEEIFRDAGKDA